jgi:cytochrome c551/c552
MLLSCTSQPKTDQFEDKNVIIPNNDYKVMTGKALFNWTCASCHHPNKKMVAGPFQKIREDYGEKWCIAYVKNNDSMREAGDIKSIFVFNKWQHMVMPKYTNLSDSQILLILDYVDSFEYVEMNNGLDHYSHRKLSINSMKDSIKAYEEKNGKY